MNAINIKGLTKKYKDTVALNDLWLDIKKGELFSLLGINGAGKSTTVKILSGILSPTSGDALVLGESVRDDINKIKTKIAVSPQETAIAPNLSVYENLEFIARAHGFSKEKAKKSCIEIADKLGLSAVLKKKAATLSGGYQRRLSIALALISEPEILFLDEPTLGLDVIARSELWELIRSLRGKTTIILTTHYMEEAEALSDRIGIMSAGRLIALGTVKELLLETGKTKFEDAFVAIVKGERV